MSGYESSLVAAGATVLAFQSFGSYQGSWYAMVDWNGERGWIEGSFGSCSECDSFENEFGYNATGCDDHWEQTEGCAECAAKAAEYQVRLVSFGKSYLDTILPAGHYLPELDERSSWDSESEEAAKWIRETDAKF